MFKRSLAVVVRCYAAEQHYLPVAIRNVAVLWMRVPTLTLATSWTCEYSDFQSMCF